MNEDKTIMYFDAIDLGGEILVGTVGEEEGDITLTESKKIPSKGWMNFYNHAMESMIHTLDLIIADEGSYTDVVLRTQHKQIYTWLSASNGDWGENYKDELTTICEKILELTTLGVNLDIEIIDGKKNKAKKYLKKQKTALVSEGGLKTGGNLNAIIGNKRLKQEHTNVVNFFERKRKQG